MPKGAYIINFYVKGVSIEYASLPDRVPVVCKCTVYSQVRA